ncbi:hypothetical protein HMPREF1989_01907 [Porphyromonas gingivalis F0566]|nr:hypothetical protein HMPREF1989_01907 [Porphyromonas gingivalis F0566]
MARELFRFGSGRKKFSRHEEKILAPLFPKTRAAIGAFPVCELRRGEFVRKGKFGRFRGEQVRTKILWATIVENCRPIYPKIYGLRKLYRYLSALTCLPIVVIRWGAFYERVI